MRKLFMVLIVIAALASCKKDALRDGSTARHPKADSLQKMLAKYVSKGVPGAVIAVKDASGFWMGADGYANTEDKTRMSADMLQYGFSITKMVTAITVMQLKEKGLVDINRPITDYLPADLHTLLPKMNAVSVKMLLNHTSGYNDYVRTEEFAARFLANPLKVWTRAEYYDLIRRNITNSFAPGTDFKYSNTNYYVLSLIIDKVTGRPHGEWFRQNIFNKLALKQMFYKHADGYPFYNNLPDVYWTGLADGETENITPAQQAWMQSEEYGATGIIASPKNYIRLLEGLVNGELVSAATFAEMKQWVQSSTSQEPDYGLGLCYWGYKGKPQYGHDGDGIGATTVLMYLPDSKTYVLAAANASTEFGGRMAQLLFGFRNEVGDYLAGF